MRITSDGKKCRSESELKELIGRYKSSGQTGAEFCKLEGIGASSLYKWLKRYGGKETKSDFIELKQSDSPNSRVKKEYAIELELPHGIVLRVS